MALASPEHSISLFRILKLILLIFSPTARVAFIAELEQLSRDLSIWNLANSLCFGSRTPAPYALSLSYDTLRRYVKVHTRLSRKGQAARR
jgi:hypothetical protein